MNARYVEIIRTPVEPHGHVIQDDTQIETLTFGSFRLYPSGSTPVVIIEIAQHIDGLWMWSTSMHGSSGGYGYRVGPKWGRFARTRQDAITAACNEIEDRGNATAEVLAWLDQLCGPQQQELFV